MTGRSAATDCIPPPCGEVRRRSCDAGVGGLRNNGGHASLCPPYGLAAANTGSPLPLWERAFRRDLARAKLLRKSHGEKGEG